MQFVCGRTSWLHFIPERAALAAVIAGPYKGVPLGYVLSAFKV